MRRTACCLFLAVSLALAGCLAQNGDLPSFAASESTLPPPAPGNARLFLYRLLEPYEIIAGTEVYLNGAAAGYARNGAVLYRDVAPGTYLVSVNSPGQFPFQFKTITVAVGQVWYLRIESLLSLSCSGGGDNTSSCRGATFVVEIVDPGQARGEMAPLSLERG